MLHAHPPVAGHQAADDGGGDGAGAQGVVSVDDGPLLSISTGRSTAIEARPKHPEEHCPNLDNILLQDNLQDIIFTMENMSLV